MTAANHHQPPRAAERIFAERRELIRVCARSVLAEADAGRKVDPHRLAWARAALDIEKVRA